MFRCSNGFPTLRGLVSQLIGAGFCRRLWIQGRRRRGQSSSCSRSAFCGHRRGEARGCRRRRVWRIWCGRKHSSKSQVKEPKKEKSDRGRLEGRVLAALRLGDVRKALQMLNSAPIAPKTKDTL